MEQLTLEQKIKALEDFRIFLTQKNFIVKKDTYTGKTTSMFIFEVRKNEMPKL